MSFEGKEHTGDGEVLQAVECAKTAVRNRTGEGGRLPVRVRDYIDKRRFNGCFKGEVLFRRVPFWGTGRKSYVTGYKINGLALLSTGLVASRAEFPVCHVRAKAPEGSSV